MYIENKKGTIRTPGPRLPEILREIVDKLIDDDWCRFSTQDGSRAWYAVGFEAYREDLKDKEDFLVLDRPETGEGGAEGEWYARSQLAGKHPNYLDQHRKRFQEKTGVPLEAMADWFKKWIESAMPESVYDEMPHSELVSPARMIDLYSERFGAFAASWRRQEGRFPEEDEAVRRRIDRGREKHFLRELSNRYPKIVDRSEQLEPISPSDTQLEEASRCYLYGFYRASIVLSATALESYLNPEGEWVVNGFYEHVVQKAVAKGMIDESLGFAAKDVFN